MNKSFCVLPFYSAEYNPGHTTWYTSPCCLLPKNTNIKQLREEILADRRPTACQKCWTVEDQGHTSRRQFHNSAFDFYIDKDIQLIEDDCRNDKFSTRIIQLYTSNLCNSTCVTCNSVFSTAWATLNNNKKIINIVDESIIKSISFKDVAMISFIGGEPLFEKRNFEVLQKLIDHNNTDCFITATTNGSVKLSSHNLNILKQFKNVNLCLSIDGVGKVFEYIRYPLKWSILLDNIELYRSLNIKLSVSYTISNLNTLYHDETVAWFNKMKLPHNHNIVSSPSYFAPSVLPTNPDVNEQLLDQCRAEIIHQDTLKKINIQDYLPEFYELMFK